ncbi:hypothetical protein IAQ61_008801 [Plenodomus lingam]|uniref:uncharacterized protein n=1 Tax=Leptosphaeria maculans TaxID=5022 RepID=UPI0033280F74|nr:hypothetical protein IAQ61_008801 [Plenodomus lingam]
MAFLTLDGCIGTGTMTLHLGLHLTSSRIVSGEIQVIGVSRCKGMTVQQVDIQFGMIREVVGEDANRGPAVKNVPVHHAT